MGLRTTPRASRHTAGTHHTHTHNTRQTHHNGVTTTKTKPTLMGRLRGEHTVTHHKRKTTLGDKISGAMMKLKGTLTRRPGEKAAGTRRMHGTDGRGSRKTRRAY